MRGKATDETTKMATGGQSLSTCTSASQDCNKNDITVQSTEITTIIKVNIIYISYISIYIIDIWDGNFSNKYNLQKHPSTSAVAKNLQSPKISSNQTTILRHFDFEYLKPDTL